MNIVNLSRNKLWITSNKKALQIEFEELFSLNLSESYENFTFTSVYNYKENCGKTIKIGGKTRSKVVNKLLITAFCG